MLQILKLNSEDQKTKKKSFIGSATGVNFINILHTSFTGADPISAKRYWKHDRIFTLFGSALVKAALKMSVKLTPEAKL